MVVSIITACFNSEKTIMKTMESVLSQSYSTIEYVVIDGNSTDKTMEIIKTYEEKFTNRGIRFKWMSEEDSGIYEAWNKGVNRATGEWLAFLGADDVYDKDAIQDYVSYITNSKKELDYVSAKVRLVANNKIVRKVEEGWNWNTFKREMKIGHVGSLHHKSYFERHGLFDTSYKIAGDYELLLRAKENLRAGFLDKYTVEMGAEGASNDKVLVTLRESCLAKINSGGRNRWLAYIEMYMVYLKICFRAVLPKSKLDA